MTTAAFVHDGAGDFLWGRGMGSDVSGRLSGPSANALIYDWHEATMADRDGNPIWAWNSPKGEWIHEAWILADERSALILSADIPPPPHGNHLADGPVTYRSRVLNADGEVVRLLDQARAFGQDGRVIHREAAGIVVEDLSGRRSAALSPPQGCPETGWLFDLHEDWALSTCRHEAGTRAEIRDLENRLIWQGAWPEAGPIRMDPARGIVWAAIGSEVHLYQRDSNQSVSAEAGFLQSRPGVTVGRTLEADLDGDGTAEVAMTYRSGPSGAFRTAVVNAKGEVLWDSPYPSLTEPGLAVLQQGAERHLAVINYHHPNLLFILRMQGDQVTQILMREADESIELQGDRFVLGRRIYETSNSYAVLQGYLTWDSQRGEYIYSEPPQREALLTPSIRQEAAGERPDFEPAIIYRGWGEDAKGRIFALAPDLQRRVSLTPPESPLSGGVSDDGLWLGYELRLPDRVTRVCLASIYDAERWCWDTRERISNIQWRPGTHQLFVRIGQEGFWLSPEGGVEPAAIIGWESALTDPEHLPPLDGTLVDPQASPDGSWVVGFLRPPGVPPNPSDEWVKWGPLSLALLDRSSDGWVTVQVDGEPWLLPEGSVGRMDGWSQDGRYAAVALYGSNSKLLVYDVAERGVRFIPTPELYGNDQGIWSRRGSWLAVPVHDQHGRFGTWFVDVATGELVHELWGNDGTWPPLWIAGER